MPRRRTTHNDSQVGLSGLFWVTTVSYEGQSTWRGHCLEQRSLSRTAVPLDPRQPRKNLKLRVVDALQTGQGELERVMGPHHVRSRP